MQEFSGKIATPHELNTSRPSRLNALKTTKLKFLHTCCTRTAIPKEETKSHKPEHLKASSLLLCKCKYSLGKRTNGELVCKASDKLT